MKNRLNLRCLLACAAVAFSVPAYSQTSNYSSSWSEIKAAGKGTVTAYWFESRPFIYMGANGEMKGIEAEIIQGFRNYLKRVHNIDLKVNWQEGKSFGHTYATIRDGKVPHCLGISAFSVTPQRERQVDFGPSYMTDIVALITSKEVPIVGSVEEFNRVFSHLTAITIRETTYETDILRLKEAGQVPFKIEYIPSSENILRHIEKQDSAFGFIDLPIYLMHFSEDPSINVKRQNLFPMKRKGYAFTFPKGSDWAIPLNAYFSEKDFKGELESIISSYIDIDLYHFMEKLANESDDQVALLTREKEIQYNSLAASLKLIEQETRRRNFLIGLVGVALVFLIIIVMLYRKRNEQKEKIEAQRQNIEQKKQQLEKRNDHLMALDEEKNNLIRILAHDLRTPINQVQGLAHVFLLSNPALPEEEKTVIRQIADASIRLNKMITNILDIDVLENDRAKIVIEKIDLVPLVQQVVVSFEKLASKKELVLSFRSSDRSADVNGDSLFLIQVFENLISNAIKFSPKGKRVDIIVECKDNSPSVSICDEGPGLSPEDQQNLFKKFQRLTAKPTDGESSTGLGLSIVKKYVVLMGGQVRCESSVGQGASFIVTFPGA